ncbi:hypothetical protein PR202_gb17757 [Eleusine coracana subsp. coracana]|uniref:Fanconi-associated nuclease n=1 Tax=Eleusine coracana subsp. coracana TaxID=191504 RepID=A0AAV5F1J7_ELECO|nr:hypothetical protein PR202_gb17757 [Eleusine coracana subsp. coracana]
MNPTDRDSPSDQTFLLDSETGSSKASSSVPSTVFLDDSLDICNIVAPPNIVLPNVKDAANDGAVEHCSSNLLQTVATSSSIESCSGANSIPTLTVDTVIVGRKFHENIELQEGARIIVERDPQNAKDHDAIKVLYAASEFEEMLGYLASRASPKFWLLCLTNIMLNVRITQPAHIDMSFLAPFYHYTMVVPVEFGLVKFPDYACCISHRIFQERSDLLEYEEAIRVAQVMDEALDDNNMEMVTRCIDLSENRLCTMSKIEIATSSQPLPLFFSRFSASWVYSKILTLGVSVYERDRRYTDAIRILKLLLRTVASDRRRGYWTLRLSVDLEHVGRPNESLSIAEGGVIDPWVRAGSKFALQRRVLRLSKPPRRWKVPSYADSVKRNIKEVNIEGRPLNCETGAKNVFYGYDGELCGVEQLALQYYADEGGGWQGTHSEGGVWMTVFGLLMWDVMFSDMEDVFQSKFQTAPLDLETDDFYKLRKDIIESQLKKIQDGMAEERC